MFKSTLRLTAFINSVVLMSVCRSSSMNTCCATSWTLSKQHFPALQCMCSYYKSYNGLFTAKHHCNYALALLKLNPIGHLWDQNQRKLNNVHPSPKPAGNAMYLFCNCGIGFLWIVSTVWFLPCTGVARPYTNRNEGHPSFW